MTQAASSSSSAETISPPIAPAPNVSGTPAPAARAPLFSAAAWSPLKVELFRNLYIATSIAQIGIWAREAASPWLMGLLMHGSAKTPTMVSLVLFFSNLPICLFSVFAGSLADVLDRRRLLIWTHVWMVVVSAVLGLLTLGGHITPAALLGLTFLLGVGTAATGPALQAVLPELVPPKDMALAINLNSVALNVARAVGPATFVVVIGMLPGFGGVGTSFLISAMTFVGAVWVLSSWKRPPQRAAVHGEAMWGAIRSGFLYTVYSPANRAILIRVLTFIVPAVVFWSQVPVIATQQLRMSSGTGYAMLFAYMGTGAVLGVLLMPGLHARHRIDPVVNVCTGLFALGLIAMSFTHTPWLAAVILVFLGINWVIVPTNFNTATQKSVPSWVKGRAISWYLTVLFGSFTIGGALWGPITTATSMHTSLLIGGVSMAVMLLLAKAFPLTLNEGLDLSPAFKPGSDVSRGPLLPTADSGGANAVEVSIDYTIDPASRGAFVNAVHELARQRRRNGATRWRLTPINASYYRESFCFGSTAELARQRNRMTAVDLALHERVRAFHVNGDFPAATCGAPTGDSSSSLALRFDDACDRFLDELTNGVARIRGVPDRVGPWRRRIPPSPPVIRGRGLG